MGRSLSERHFLPGFSTTPVLGSLCTAFGHNTPAMPEYQKNSHCSCCGAAFAADASWPRRCAHCGSVTYSNPLPVSVVLLPIDAGLLLVRRTQEPQAGRLALPGGFIETGETWQQAGAREVFEETGYTIDPAGIRLFDTLSAPDGTLLVFGLAQPVSLDALPPFTPSSETSEATVAREPMELAFSTHTETAARFWKENSHDQADPRP